MPDRKTGSDWLNIYHTVILTVANLEHLLSQDEVLLLNKFTTELKY